MLAGQFAAGALLGTFLALTIIVMGFPHIAPWGVAAATPALSIAMTVAASAILIGACVVITARMMAGPFSRR